MMFTLCLRCPSIWERIDRGKLAREHLNLTYLREVVVLACEFLSLDCACGCCVMHITLILTLC